MGRGSKGSRRGCALAPSKVRWRLTPRWWWESEETMDPPNGNRLSRIGARSFPSGVMPALDDLSTRVSQRPSSESQRVPRAPDSWKRARGSNWPTFSTNRAAARAAEGRLGQAVWMVPGAARTEGTEMRPTTAGPTRLNAIARDTSRRGTTNNTSDKRRQCQGLVAPATFAPSTTLSGRRTVRSCVDCRRCLLASQDARRAIVQAVYEKRTFKRERYNYG